MNLKTKNNGNGLNNEINNGFEKYEEELSVDEQLEIFADIIASLLLTQINNEKIKHKSAS
jgi:hypothetical protein